MLQIEAFLPEDAAHEAHRLFEESGAFMCEMAPASGRDRVLSPGHLRVVATLAYAQAAGLLPAFGELVARVDGLAFVTTVG